MTTTPISLCWRTLGKHPHFPQKTSRSKIFNNYLGIWFSLLIILNVKTKLCVYEDQPFILLTTGELRCFGRACVSLFYWEQEQTEPDESLDSFTHRHHHHWNCCSLWNQIMSCYDRFRLNREPCVVAAPGFSHSWFHVGYTCFYSGI